MQRLLKQTENISPVVLAMRNLRASGDSSFEELTAQLLSKISGTPIRRCRAGDQGGVDAVGSIPFAIEDKRHRQNVDGRELLGGLAMAVRRYPELELWVLIATCSIGEQARKDLTGDADERGIAVLILDTTAAEPELRGTSSIAALAATDIETTLSALLNPRWRVRGGKPDIASIRRELNAIRRRSAFAAWETQLRTAVRDLPTWHRLVRSQNQRLGTSIRHDASAAFNIVFDHKQSIQRTAEAELTTWWERCQTAAPCSVALIAGERYDGKTWLVFRWLMENLDRIPLPVFFLPARRVEDERGQIETLLRREAEEALGTFARHAQAIITRRRWSKADAGPWCMVILDGANEYVQNPAAFGDAIRWAYPPENVPLQSDDGGLSPPDRTPVASARRCALVVTCRSVDVPEAMVVVADRPTHPIKLQPYDDRELDDALAKSSLTKKDLATLPADAQAMVRHPLYFDLSRDYWRELGHFGGATSTILHYLEATRKLLPQTWRRRLSPAKLKEFLAKLARRWRCEPVLDQGAVRQEMSALTEQVDAQVAELISDGVLAEVDGKLVPDPHKLALGMGLAIRDKLLASSHRRDWPQVLRDMLEPHGDIDEKVRWLRTAVTTSALADDDDRHPELLDFLLASWLSARNFSETDLDELRNLTPLLVRSIVRLISSPSDVSESLLLTAEAMIQSEIVNDPQPFADAVRRWLRFVPTDPPWPVEEGDELPNFAQRVADPSLTDLLLVLAPPDAGKIVRKLQRLSLSLAFSHPVLVRPLDLLAFIAGRNASTDWPLVGDGETVAIRRALTFTDRAWFDREVDASKNSETPRAKALGALMMYSERSDLRDLFTMVPMPRWQTWPSAMTVRQVFSAATGNILQAASRAEAFALNPATPSPPRTWRVALSRAARARFAGGIRPYAARSVTKDGFDLRNAEPALAAWALEAGAAIRRSILADVPRQIANGEQSWSWDIQGHAALLTNADRRRLLQAVLAVVGNSEREGILESAYLCVLAGAAPQDRLRLLLDHPFAVEYSNLYDVVSATSEETLRRETEAAVRTERNALRLRRARYLLTYLGGMEASVQDLAFLIADVTRADLSDDDKNAAHELLEYARIRTSTPADALGPLVSVARSQAEEAWQYEAFLDVTRRHGTRGAEWVARARSAPRTARHHGAGDERSDKVAVARGIEQLGARIGESLDSRRRFGIEQFPRGLAATVGAETFDRWVRRLLDHAADGIHFDAGLLLPIVSHALRTRHPAARELWMLVHPFQRGRFSGRTRFTDHGLDWTLPEIHDPAVDEDLGREILRALIADCRSDSELAEVALAARLTSIERLWHVASAMLNSDDEFDRARARFIVGWMPESAARRKRLGAPDASCWVERIGERATYRLDQERWAREWLRRFLAEPRRDRRWAAGRLFLGCTDAATMFWAPQIIRKATVAPPERRAEARLLVKSIRAKTNDSHLRDRFLGYAVRELEGVVPPWRTPIRWDAIEVGREDADAT